MRSPNTLQSAILALKMQQRLYQKLSSIGSVCRYSGSCSYNAADQCTIVSQAMCQTQGDECLHRIQKPTFELHKQSLCMLSCLKPSRRTTLCLDSTKYAWLSGKRTCHPSAPSTKTSNTVNILQATNQQKYNATNVLQQNRLDQSGSGSSGDKKKLVKCSDAASVLAEVESQLGALHSLCQGSPNKMANQAQSLESKVPLSDNDKISNKQQGASKPVGRTRSFVKLLQLIGNVPQSQRKYYKQSMYNISRQSNQILNILVNEGAQQGLSKMKAEDLTFACSILSNLKLLDSTQLHRLCHVLINAYHERTPQLDHASTAREQQGRASPGSVTTLDHGQTTDSRGPSAHALSSKTIATALRCLAQQYHCVYGRADPISHDDQQHSVGGTIYEIHTYADQTSARGSDGEASSIKHVDGNGSECNYDGSSVPVKEYVHLLLQIHTANIQGNHVNDNITALWAVSQLQMSRVYQSSVDQLKIQLQTLQLQINKCNASQIINMLNVLCSHVLHVGPRSNRVHNVQDPQLGSVPQQAGEQYKTANQAFRDEPLPLVSGQRDTHDGLESYFRNSEVQSLCRDMVVKSLHRCCAMLSAQHAIHAGHVQDLSQALTSLQSIAVVPQTPVMVSKTPASQALSLKAGESLSSAVKGHDKSTQNDGRLKDSMSQIDLLIANNACMDALCVWLSSQKRNLSLQDTGSILSQLARFLSSLNNYSTVEIRQISQNIKYNYAKPLQANNVAKNRAGLLSDGAAKNGAQDRLSKETTLQDPINTVVEGQQNLDQAIKNSLREQIPLLVQKFREFSQDISVHQFSSVADVLQAYALAGTPYGDVQAMVSALHEKLSEKLNIENEQVAVQFANSQVSSSLQSDNVPEKQYTGTIYSTIPGRQSARMMWHVVKLMYGSSGEHEGDDFGRFREQGEAREQSVDNLQGSVAATGSHAYRQNMFNGLSSSIIIGLQKQINNQYELKPEYGPGAKNSFVYDEFGVSDAVRVLHACGRSLYFNEALVNSAANLLKRKIKNMNTQDISNCMWSLGRLYWYDENFMHSLMDQLVVIVQPADLHPTHLAQVMFCCAKLNHTLAEPHRKLLHDSLLINSHQMSIQQLAMCAWSMGVMSVQSPFNMINKLRQRLKALNGLNPASVTEWQFRKQVHDVYKQDMKWHKWLYGDEGPQQTVGEQDCNVQDERSVVLSNAASTRDKSSSFLDDNIQREQGTYKDKVLQKYQSYDGEGRSQINTPAVTQLYFAHMLLKARFDVDLLEQLDYNLCQEHWSQVTKLGCQGSDLQSEVYHCLQQAGLTHLHLFQEFVDEDELIHVDIAAITSDQKLKFAIEVNGPHHYLRSNPKKELGESIARRYLLQSFGWKVLPLHFEDWPGIKDSFIAKLRVVNSLVKPQTDKLVPNAIKVNEIISGVKSIDTGTPRMPSFGRTYMERVLLARAGYRDDTDYNQNRNYLTRRTQIAFWHRIQGKRRFKRRKG